jgi:protein phosphatase
MRAIAVGLSDVGLQREQNEDSFVVDRARGIFVVADGMGGHPGGDMASKLATKAVVEFVRDSKTARTWPFHYDTHLTEEENCLLASIRVANRTVFEHSTRSLALHGMGTTLVSAYFSAAKKTMFVAHVGDSRCYLMRAGRLDLLTRDHSLVNDYLAAIPDLTEEQRAELPKNVITRAIGMQDEVVIDLQHCSLQPGDVFLLCTDGLHGMLSDEVTQAILASGSDLPETCQRLVHEANERGGDDNITVLLVRVEEDVA